MFWNDLPRRQGDLPNCAADEVSGLIPAMISDARENKMTFKKDGDTF